MTHTMTSPTSDARAPYRGPERRRQVRLEDRFPARVQGVGLDGRAFDVEVCVDNLCAGGFYLCLPLAVGLGAKLSTTIRFSVHAPAPARARCLAVHGTVRRAESAPGGGCGVGVEFEHHIFL